MPRNGGKGLINPNWREILEKYRFVGVVWIKNYHSMNNKWVKFCLVYFISDTFSTWKYSILPPVIESIIYKVIGNLYQNTLFCY